jgi:hypothetical protein
VNLTDYSFECVTVIDLRADGGPRGPYTTAAGRIHNILVRLARGRVVYFRRRSGRESSVVRGTTAVNVIFAVEGSLLAMVPHDNIQYNICVYA